ncbi:FadR family transcriptional regulator [Gordonia sp. TBRC 11910]|uniref:FadR family transcriptional regulator n=2 Tax=Gordonia asplenii TaxID=2725283 RepID=A0A848KR68_9ACTN|nr:FadR family transcriptional regulator [Gordonia asplenii]
MLGLLHDGDQLPSELDLADQFGVANGTIREALRLLREQGVVDTRRGRGGGSFVRTNDAAMHSLHFDRLSGMNATELRDLGDEQTAIFAAVARLAAERAAPTATDRLRRLVAALRVAATPAQRRRAEARFHIELAVESQSVRLTHSEVRLQAELGPMIWLPGHSPDHKEVADRLEAITVSVGAGDSTHARVEAENHALSCIRTVLTTHMAIADT